MRSWRRRRSITLPADVTACIHGAVGMSDQLRRTFTVAWKACDTHTGVEPNGIAIWQHQICSLDPCAQIFGDSIGVLRAAAREEHDELVAADPCHQVALAHPL